MFYKFGAGVFHFRGVTHETVKQQNSPSGEPDGEHLLQDAA
jgi:hypothetical protein